MTRRKLTAGAVAVAAIATFVVAVGRYRQNTRSNGLAGPSSVGGAAEPTRGSPRPAIELVRLSPPNSSSGKADIDCSSFDSVEFSYEVFNRGQAPITGLKVGTKCACESVGDPTQDILPGQSGTISFRLRAPRFGRMDRKIALLIEGTSEPIAMIDVSLRVKFDPPGLIVPSSALSFTFVAGKTSAHELVLDAIEATEAEHWISGIDLDPSDSVEVLPPKVEELREPDADLKRRRYHFPLVNRSLPVGRHSAAAAIRTSAGFPTVRERMALQIDVTDSLALAPNPLVIKYDRGTIPPPRRVSIINRGGGRAVATPVKYDSGLLRVEAAGKQAGSTAAFEVSPLGTPESRSETQVVFDTGDDQTRILVVRFEPSERP